MKKVILIIFFYIFSLNYCSSQTLDIVRGTTIAIVMKRDTVWIGADTKLYSFQGYSLPSGCKILKFDNIVITHTGVSESKLLESSKKIFSFTDEVSHIAKTNQNVDTIISKVHINTVNALTLIGPHFIRKEYNVGDTVLDLRMDNVFSYIKDNKPVVDVVKYYVIKNNLNGYEITWAKSNMSFNDQLQLKILGEVNVSSAYLLENREENLHIYGYGDPSILINKIIEIESIAKPDKVGLPIDIIRITNNEIRWIQRQEQCN